MEELIIAIILATLAIAILLIDYLQSKENNSMHNRKLTCETDVLEAEKQVLIEALEAVVKYGNETAADIALDTLRRCYPEEYVTQS